MENTLAQKAVEIANSQMGVTEHPAGSNSGPEVNAYLAAVHVPPGNAWCAGFACWCVQKAAGDLGYGTPEMRFSGSALNLWRRNFDRQISPSALTPDDLPCVVVWDHGGGKGHVGFAVGLDTDTGHLQTIEGNSDAAGSRTGGSVVAQTKRTLSDPQLLGFLRIS